MTAPTPTGVAAGHAHNNKTEAPKSKGIMELTDTDIDILLMGGAATMISIAAGFRTIYGALGLFMVLYAVLRYFWKPQAYPLEVRGHRGLTLEEESKRMSLRVTTSFGERLELDVRPAADKVIDIKLAALMSSKEMPQSMTELDVDLLWGEIPLADDKSLAQILGECTRPRSLVLRAKMQPPGSRAHGE